MWLYDALRSGFNLEVDAWSIQLFRLCVATACLFKFVVDLAQGGFVRLSRDSFTRHQLIGGRWRRQARLLIALHRPVHVLRLVAAVTLLAGIHPNASALVAALGLVHELIYEYRRHAVYLAAVLILCLPAGRLADGVLPRHHMTTENTWSQFLVVVLTIQMYWSSAWHKARSHQFSSGRLLAQFVRVASLARPQQRYPEYWYPVPPDALVARVYSGKFWPVIARSVIVCETVLPIGLILPLSWRIAVFGGLLMHLCFTALLPIRLIPYTLATVGSFVLFNVSNSHGA